MSLDTSSVQVFTDAELLVLWRAAYAAVSTGRAYTMRDRSLTREDSKEIRENIEWLESRVNNAASSATSTEGGNVAYAKFNDPV